MEVREPSGRYLLLPTMQDTVIGPLPADWYVGQLAEHAHIQSGIAKNANATIRDPIEVPYLRVANVQDGYLDLAEVSTIQIERSELGRFAVLPNDVLMNEGGDLDKLGRGALWGGTIQPCVHQNHVFVVRCKPGLEPAYLNAWTSSAQARRYFLLAGRQTTNLASINKASLGGLAIALPASEAEQSAIAQALTDTDALIDSLEQLLTKKRQIKQGAMQELLTGKRRLPGFKGSWKAQALGSLARIQRGASPRPIDSPVWFDPASSIGWVRISDVTQSGMFLEATTQYLSPTGVQSSRFVPAGSLIMSICATVGRPVITKLDTCIHDGFVVFADLRVDKAYLHYVLTSIEPEWGQHGQTGSQMNLNTGLIERTSISVPQEPAEQQAIAQILTDIDADLTALEARLKKARQLKQAMMQVLLTGRIRCWSPQWWPTDALSALRSGLPPGQPACRFCTAKIKLSCLSFQSKYLSLKDFFNSIQDNMKATCR